MNKYLNIFKTSFKQESKTLSNSLLGCVSFVVIIYIFWQLWGYIYGNNVQDMIAGYSLKTMLWYLISAEILMYAVNSRGTTYAFSHDIKSGKIAYQLNKPYNYYFYQIFNNFGSYIWKLLFLIPTAVIFGLILLGPMENFSIAYAVPILISLLLAVLLTCVIFGAIGLLAFWVEEATPFSWIMQKFQMLFGLFFPPEFFPVWFQPVINYSPVYAMMSGTCKLFANFSWDLFLKVTISQVCWISFFIGLGIILYKFGSKKVNMNGG